MKNPQIELDSQEVASWGKSILEEVLFHAALNVENSSANLDKVEVSLPLRITADKTGERLIVSCDTVTGSTFNIKVPLSGTTS